MKLLFLTHLLACTWSLVHSAPFDVLVARELSAHLDKRHATAQGYGSSLPGTLPNQNATSQYGLISTGNSETTNYSQKKVAPSPFPMSQGQQQLANHATFQPGPIIYTDPLSPPNYSPSINGSNTYENNSNFSELQVRGTESVIKTNNNTYSLENTLAANPTNATVGSYPVYYVTGDAKLTTEAPAPESPKNTTISSLGTSPLVNTSSQRTEAASYPVYYISSYNETTPQTAENPTLPNNLSMEASNNKNVSSYPIFYVSIPNEPGLQSENISNNWSGDTGASSRNETAINSYTVLNSSSTYPALDGGKKPSTGSPVAYGNINSSTFLQSSTNSYGYSSPPTVPTVSQTLETQPTTSSYNYSTSPSSSLSSSPTKTSLHTGDGAVSLASSASQPEKDSYGYPGIAGPSAEYQSYAVPSYNESSASSASSQSKPSPYSYPGYQTTSLSPYSLLSGQTPASQQAPSYYPATTPAPGAPSTPSQPVASPDYSLPSVQVQGTNLSNLSSADVSYSKTGLAYDNASYIIASPPASPAVLFLPSPLFPLSQGFLEAAPPGDANFTSNETNEASNINATISGVPLTAQTNSTLSSTNNINRTTSSLVSPAQPVKFKTFPKANAKMLALSNNSVNLTTAQTTGLNTTRIPKNVSVTSHSITPTQNKTSNSFRLAYSKNIQSNPLPSLVKAPPTVFTMTVPVPLYKPKNVAPSSSNKTTSVLLSSKYASGYTSANKSIKQGKTSSSLSSPVGSALKNATMSPLLPLGKTISPTPAATNKHTMASSSLSSPVAGSAVKNATMSPLLQLKKTTSLSPAATNKESMASSSLSSPVVESAPKNATMSPLPQLEKTISPPPATTNKQSMASSLLSSPVVESAPKNATMSPLPQLEKTISPPPATTNKEMMASSSLSPPAVESALKNTTMSPLLQLGKTTSLSPATTNKEIMASSSLSPPVVESAVTNATMSPLLQLGKTISPPPAATNKHSMASSSLSSPVVEFSLKNATMSLQIQLGRTTSPSLPYRVLLTTRPPPPVFHATSLPKPNAKGGKWGFGDKYLASQNQRARHRNVIFDGIAGDSQSFSNYQVLSQQDVFFPRNVRHLGRKRRSISQN